MNEHDEGAASDGAATPEVSGVGADQPAPSSSGVGPSGAAPVAAPERIEALDVARGFALVGIFMVNVALFAMPAGMALTSQPPTDEGSLSVAAWMVVRVFCESKFYPLFSLLFGFGLILQRDRAVNRGALFGFLYLRRLMLLGAMGLLHGILIWFGDVLFLYSFAGFLLFLVAGWGRRRLQFVAALALAIAVGGATLFSLAGTGPPALELPTTQEALELERVTFGEVWQAVAAGETEPLVGPLWIGAEVGAYKDGPYLAQLTMRAVTFLIVLFVYFLGPWWHIVFMFFVGAALARSGFFDAGWRDRWRALVLWALCLGVPLSAVAVYFARQSQLVEALYMPLTFLIGPLIAVGYLAFWTWTVSEGRLRWLTSLLAAGGRMALTNYIGQSVVASFFMYSWGLNWFLETTYFERFVLVLGIFAAQLLLSRAWLRVFRFGPLEWLWRSATYLKLQPLLRS